MSDKEEKINALITKLREGKDSGARWWAAWALARIGGKEAVEALIEALEEDENYWVRDEAARALGKIGGEEAEKALTEALRRVFIQYNDQVRKSKEMFESEEQRKR